MGWNGVEGVLVGMNMILVVRVVQHLVVRAGNLMQATVDCFQVLLLKVPILDLLLAQRVGYLVIFEGCNEVVLVRFVNLHGNCEVGFCVWEGGGRIRSRRQGKGR